MLLWGLEPVTMKEACCTHIKLQKKKGDVSVEMYCLKREFPSRCFEASETHHDGKPLYKILLKYVK